MKKVGIGIGALAAVLMICGCAKTTQELDGVESRDPLVRSARAKEEQGDKDAAIMLLQRSLEKNPNSALSHLRLALLYDDHAKDYTRAIYHYQRYLELRPNAEKRDMIMERVREAEVRLCASLSGLKPALAEDSSYLKEENARLKSDLRQLRRNIAQIKTATTAGAVEQRVESAPSESGVSSVRGKEEKSSDAGNESGFRTVTVERGDTLSDIASRVYQNPREWKRIYDANRETIGDDPRRLKIGQELVVPD